MPRVRYETREDFDAAYAAFCPHGEQVGYQRCVLLPRVRQMEAGIALSYGWTTEKSILVVGSGFGWGVEVLKDERGFHTVLGTETSPWIQAAKHETNPHDDLPWSRYPELILPVDVALASERAMLREAEGRFDIIVTEQVISCLTETEFASLSQGLRADLLSPGGQLLHVDTPRLEGVAQDPDYLWLSPSEWKALAPQDDFFFTTGEMR